MAPAATFWRRAALVNAHLGGLIPILLPDAEDAVPQTPAVQPWRRSSTSTIFMNLASESGSFALQGELVERGLLESRT